MAVVQKILCHIEQITNYGENVYTLDLKPERLIPRFRPGQFLHLALDNYDPSGFWPESRVFSIASSPLQRDHIRISYSVRGRFTARMEKELHEGRRVWIKLPYGDFVIKNTTDIALFAGGTGITAFTAFLQGLTPDIKQNIYLAYGARNRSLLIYRGLIDKLSQRVHALRVYHFIENDAEDMPSLTKGEIRELKGCLSIASVWQEIQNPFETTFYLSGPPLMLKNMTQELHNLGIQEEAVKTDAWE